MPPPKHLLQILSILVAISWNWCGHAAESKLEVRFCDVGQADAILVTCPEGQHHLLIDSGDKTYPESTTHFRAFLTNAFTGKPRRITVAVASHQHTDHIASMQWVLENFEVETYVDNGDTIETTTFARLQAVRRKQIKSGRLTYVNGKQNSFSAIDFCPLVKMQIFEPWAYGNVSDKNNRSVAVRLDYKQSSFLFVGDLEKAAEQIMLNGFREAERQRLDVDVLKVGHHCSDTSSTEAFINAVSPKIAIVSCGKKGVGTNVQYKHPRLSTLRSYQTWFKNHAPPLHPTAGTVFAFDATNQQWRSQTRPDGMWLTVKDGTVIVRTDGQTLEVEGAGQ